MPNFVWFAKKSVNAKPFLVRTIFCTHQNFCKLNEISKIPSSSFGGCKNYIRRENPLFLDIHSQHMDYEANVTVWLPAILIELDGSPASVNRRMTPLICIFLRNRASGTKTITNCWCSKNRFCMKSKRQKSAIKTFRGSIFHSQIRPETLPQPDTRHLYGKLIKLIIVICH